MTFIDAEKEYYKMSNEHITKEKFLKNLLKLIKDIESFKVKVEISVSITKIVLNHMYDCVNNDMDFVIGIEQAKIAVNVLGEFLKNQTNNESEKRFISTLINLIKYMIDNKSKMNNYKRRKYWR